MTNMSNMKTAIIYPNNPFRIYKEDEWDSFRSEGRVPINIGFGLSLLDYDTNIIYNGWNIENYKMTWNNIKLSKQPLLKKYDLALSFSNFNQLNAEFEKGLSIVYEKSHIDRTMNYIKSTGNSNIHFVITHKDLIKLTEKQIKRNVIYIPPLYPIPSINDGKGFIPCSFNPTLPELKVFLIYTSWSQNTTIGGDRFTYHEQVVINHLKNKGYKVKLSILVEKREINCPLKFDNIETEFFYSNECNYKKIIDLILNNDICITNGASVFPGNCMTDIVTLGKPLIYICDGRFGIESTFNVNLLYSIKDNNIIYIQESDTNLIESKVDKLLSNPIEICKTYKEIHKDQDINNWKNIVKKALNEL